MSSKNPLSIFILWLLKIAVIIFLLPFFYNLTKSVNIDIEFWNTLVKILIIIAFFGLSILLLVIRKSVFYIFGFLLVFVISIYQIIFLLSQKGLNSEISLYFLLAAVSFYFMTKYSRTSG